MSVFKNRLYDIIDDEPVINAVIVNLGPFKRLYKADKSVDKAKYKSQLQYCFLVGDYESPIFNMEHTERQLQACELSFGNRNIKRNITKQLEAAVDLYKKCQSTVERRTLETIINSCDSLNSNLNNLKSSHELLFGILKDIDVDIKNATSTDEKIELFTAKQDLEEKSLKNNKTISDLISKSTGSLDAIVQLRQKANQAHSELEDELGDFIIDTLILERELKD